MVTAGTVSVAFPAVTCRVSEGIVVMALDHSCQVQRHPLAERGFDDEFVGTAATKEEARNAIFTALDGPGGTK